MSLFSPEKPGLFPGNYLKKLFCSARHMRRLNRKGWSSKAACNACRWLVSDDSSRLEKGGMDLETLPAIDLDTPPQLDLALPELPLAPDAGEEPTP